MVAYRGNLRLCGGGGVVVISVVVGVVLDFGLWFGFGLGYAVEAGDFVPFGPGGIEQRV